MKDRIEAIKVALSKAFSTDGTDRIMCEVKKDGREYMAHTSIDISNVKRNDPNKERSAIDGQNDCSYYWYAFGKTEQLALAMLLKEIKKDLELEIKARQEALGLLK